MNQKKALKVAIKAMQDQRRKYAFDRNLSIQLQLTNPTNRNAIKQYEDLTAAIEILTQLSKES